jgi:hypothetical protein
MGSAVLASEQRDGIYSLEKDAPLPTQTVFALQNSLMP